MLLRHAPHICTTPSIFLQVPTEELYQDQRVNPLIRLTWVDSPSSNCKINETQKVGLCATFTRKHLRNGSCRKVGICMNFKFGNKSAGNSTQGILNKYRHSRSNEVPKAIGKRADRASQGHPGDFHMGDQGSQDFLYFLYESTR